MISPEPSGVGSQRNRTDKAGLVEGAGLCCLSLGLPASVTPLREWKHSFPWGDYEDCEALEEQSILSDVCTFRLGERETI